MSDAGAPERDSSARLPLQTDLNPVVSAVRAAGAEAFVAVADRADRDLRYLTRSGRPERPYGVVVTPESAGAPATATLLAPARSGPAGRRFVDAATADGAGVDGASVDSADATTGAAGADAVTGAASTDEADATADAFHDGIVRAVRTDRAGDPVGTRAAAVLDERRSGGDELLVPRSIPHDAAVYLERAGYVLSSNPVVAETRAVKTPAEIDRIRRVQRAAAAGMARAETVLARSEPGPETEDGGETADSPGVRAALRWNGETLTAERLRRAVNATLAGAGVSDANNTVIGAGQAAAARRAGDGPIRAGETVVVDVAPRGPDGYHGGLTRTFVVDGDGGWARRAYVAVEAAREAALAEAEPGAPAATVHGEAAAELAAYGFDPDAASGEAGFAHGAGHGVGVSRREPPSLPGDDALRAGHVLAVRPSVYDPAAGGVRVADVVVVREDGYEVLAEYPFGTAPIARE